MKRRHRCFLRALTLLAAAAVLASPLSAAPGAAGTASGTRLRWDLSRPPYNPEDCPDWARVPVPERMLPYQGKNGLPDWHPYTKDDLPIAGSSVAGLDLYQSNHFIVYRPETAAWLYGEYTPPEAGYVPGTLPSFERIVAEYTTPDMSDTRKALALLKNALPEIIRHPGGVPMLGRRIRADRNLSDEELLAGGAGYCNEQARVFIRLCQVAGLQARNVHLFGQAHSTAEFYAEGRWVLVDVSYQFAARGEDGRLLSAAECHDRGPGQRAWARSKKDRYREIATLSDTWLNVADPEEGQRVRRRFLARATPEREKALAESTTVIFGVINYPLPPAP